MSECLDQNVLGDVNSFSELLLNRLHKDRDRELQRMREETTKEAADQIRKLNHYKWCYIYIDIYENGPECWLANAPSL